MDRQPSVDDDRITATAPAYDLEDRESLVDEGHASARDIVAVASDLVETQLRARPIPTLLTALAAGWVVGRILR